MNRRSARRASGFFLAAAIALAAAPAAPAVADTAPTGPTYFGWWYELNTPPLGDTAPVPPDAPPGGLYLAAGPAGPAAVSALHFNGTGAGDATLTLKAATGSTYATAAILACPITGTWNPATGGGWDAQPKADCARAGGGVKGIASAAGDAMAWKLGPSFQPDPTSYDVVLLPQGPVPFRVAVPLPDTNTLDAPVAPVVAPPAPESSPPAEAPAPATGDLGSPVAVTPSAPAATVPARPRARARTAPSVAGGSNPAANAVLAKAPDSRRQRVLAAMMLALLAAALWWFGGAESRGPRLLGSLGGAPGSTTAAAPATVVGGIGRFARPRAGRPQPLT